MLSGKCIRENLAFSDMKAVVIPSYLFSPPGNFYKNFIYIKMFFS